MCISEMKLAIGLVILCITIVDSNQHENSTVIAKGIDDGTDSNKNIKGTEITKKVDYGIDRNSGNRRWMNIFPKNTQKFVVTMKSVESRNNSNPFIKQSRKTPLFKLIPRVVNNKDENYWKKVTTRQPLMKFTRFTMNPLTTARVITNARDIERENARKYKYVVNKMMSASKKDDSSEKQGFTTDERRMNDKPKQVNAFSSTFRKIRSRVVNNIKNPKQVPKNEEADSKSRTSSEFSSEEREDKEEFIFVKPKQIKENSVKLIKDSSESDESTTVVFEHESKKRHKRSTNVIEEENLGTTVSGFKFTGKVASLSSDLVFRNINT